jgi:hypothetical protein
MIKISILAAALLLASLIIHAQNKEHMSQEVLTGHKRIYQAVAGKNEKDLQLMLSHEFVFTSALAELWDKEKFIKGFAMHPSISFEVFETSGEDIKIIDNTAILTALAHIKIKKGDQPVQELWERVTETYVKQQEIWSVVAIHATFVKK